MAYKDPDKQRQYQREWRARRRDEWFADKVCVDCNTTENLQLDHVDPSLKIDHRIWSWSAARREAELAKCVVRCHDCHVVKTVAHGDKRTARQREAASKRTQIVVEAGPVTCDCGRVFPHKYASLRHVSLCKPH
ncbi:HNH endonuclease [Gordonia phage GodonK]|uniref:HNH endonuclease n=1 Tax=Gordonia phage GodonK TaxID=2562192 RepID=A0A4D6E3X2_9CAUD|nr:HNH endonuclease [Gordonia phage GodonK]QBZ72742.1 HNH endonuclease [Gordonia phage GodonK]